MRRETPTVGDTKRWYAKVFVKKHNAASDNDNEEPSGERRRSGRGHERGFNNNSSSNSSSTHNRERKTSSPDATSASQAARRLHSWPKWSRAQPHRAIQQQQVHGEGASTSSRCSDCSSDTNAAPRIAIRPAPLVLRVFGSNADPPMTAFVSRRLGGGAVGASLGSCSVREGLQDRQDMLDAQRISQAPAPCMADIMSGESAAPYSLELFKLWSQVNLVSENLGFLTATAQLRSAPLSELTIRARALLASFVRLNSENEINLCDSTRRKVITTVTRVSAKLDRALQARRAATAKPGAFRRASYTVAAVSAASGQQQAPYYDVAAALHQASGNVSADESIMRLQQELKTAFAPAERQIYNLVQLDAHPRFVAAVTAALTRFAAGHAMLLQDEDLARTAVAHWRARLEQQKQQRCSGSSVTQPGSPEVHVLEGFTAKRRDTLP